MTALHPLVSALLPEIILAAGASFILLVGLIRSRAAADAVVPLTLLTVLAALFAGWRLEAEPAPPHPALAGDSLVWYVRLAALTVGLLILLANRHVPAPADRGEYFALILFSLAGVMLVPAANDLILLFLALELVSVPTYILVGLSRTDVRAQEATAKYFFLGAFAAAMTLYGFSFLYGAAGTTRLFGGAAHGQSVAAALTTIGAETDAIVILGLLLTLAGLAFKIAAVPLHFYVADVYQGAASPIAGMLGFVPKFAGFLAIIRVLSLTNWSYGDALFWLLWVLAAATMLVGNTLALMQHNVKRMLAYSSIAHSGYVLVGLVAGPALHRSAFEFNLRAFADTASPLRDGLAAAMFYLVLYGVMNLGAFAALSFFRKPGGVEDDSAESLDDVAGCARRHPWATLALSVCVLGLMGFPVTAGFLGKLYLFSAAYASVDAESARHTAIVALVVIGVLNSAVAAAYYLRIIAACYLREPAEGVTASPCRSLRTALALCAVVALAAFFRPGPILDRAAAAVGALQQAPTHARQVAGTESSRAR